MGSGGVARATAGDERAESAERVSGRRSKRSRRLLVSLLAVLALTGAAFAFAAVKGTKSLVVRKRAIRSSTVPRSPSSRSSTVPRSTSGRSAVAPSADHVACASGDMFACDQLYAESEPGSFEGRFGSTCGGTRSPHSGFCKADGPSDAVVYSANWSTSDGFVGNVSVRLGPVLTEREASSAYFSQPGDWCNIFTRGDTEGMVEMDILTQNLTPSVQVANLGARVEFGPPLDLAEVIDDGDGDFPQICNDDGIYEPVSAAAVQPGDGFRGIVFVAIPGYFATIPAGDPGALVNIHSACTSRSTAVQQRSSLTAVRISRTAALRHCCICGEPQSARVARTAFGLATDQSALPNWRVGNHIT